MSTSGIATKHTPETSASTSSRPKEASQQSEEPNQDSDVSVKDTSTGGLLPE